MLVVYAKYEIGERKMKTKVLLIALLLLMVIAVPLPANAWVYPDGTEDENYERFGPRLDAIHMLLYPDQELEWDDLENGIIDITDWPLTLDRINDWTGSPDIQMASYGAELGYYLVDINNDNTPYKTDTTDYPNPVYTKNPCGDAKFRHALQKTFDRDWLIADVWKGQAVGFYTPIPPSVKGGHPNASIPIPYALDLLIPSTYPATPYAVGLAHIFNTTRAIEILDAAGYVDTDTPLDGWRNFPVSLGGDGNNINLVYYSRVDDPNRDAMCTAHAAWIRSIGVQVQEEHADRSTAFQKVMVEKDFELYTGGWGLGSDDPDFLILYHSDYYWHPGFCYDYGRIDDAGFNDLVDELLEANTMEIAIEKAYEAQVRFNYHTLGAIFGICSSGVKAWSARYTGGNDEVLVSPDDGENQYRGANWTHTFNRVSAGIDSFYTFLNAHPEGYEYGNCEDMTMRWGFKTSSIERPSNPCYAEWVWDWNVLGLTYESLLATNPNPPFDYIPWMSQNYTAITWVDPIDGLTKSGVRFRLREDVLWSDGTPMTAADVVYTLTELPHKLMDLGFGPPWWWSNAVYIKSMYVIDPLNIEILLDIKSVFAVGWIGGCIILPKHIYEPLVETPGYDFWKPYVDPNVIGTGPYRFVHYTESIDVLVVANKPGDDPVQTAWPGSTPITSPGYFRYGRHLDFSFQAEDGLAKHEYDEIVTYHMNVENLEYEGKNFNTSITVVDGANATLYASGLKVDEYIEPQTILSTWDLEARIILRDWGYNYVHVVYKSAAYDILHFRLVKWIRVHDNIAVTWKGAVVWSGSFDAWAGIVIDIWFKTPHLYGNPPICTKILRSYEWSYATLAEDIVGSTWYDDVGYEDTIAGGEIKPFTGYPAWLKEELPTPDGKVRVNDVLACATAFGSQPGHPRWSSICDISGDYKVRVNDVLAVAMQFGWTG